MSSQTLQACNKLGIRVPEQLKLIGFDDSFVAKLTTPRLTTIHQPTREMAAIAVKLLKDAVEKKLVPKQTILPVSLIERGRRGLIQEPPQERKAPAAVLVMEYIKKRESKLIRIDHLADHKPAVINKNLNQVLIQVDLQVALTAYIRTSGSAVQGNKLRQKLCAVCADMSLF